MLTVIDNYDSFTWNLVQILGGLGAEVDVVRNDEVTVETLVRRAPERLVVSPGPGTPREAGVSVEAIRAMAPSTPVLGVCLGHQAIGEAFGGSTVPASQLMHGKVRPIVHRGDPLFEGIPSPFEAARYHWLVTSRELPPGLVPIAWSEDPADEEEVQAIRHEGLRVWGVQFHPESLFSEGGARLLENFLSL